MGSRPTAVVFAAEIDRSLPEPLHRQLYAQLRKAILVGRFSPGSRLPSTRDLANELRISRNTVMNAFLQLLAEGYLEGKVGSGTYVSSSLPEELLQARTETNLDSKTCPPIRKLSQRGALFASAPTAFSGYKDRPRAFQPGLPALREFPFAIWRKLSSEVWGSQPQELLGYGDPAGYKPLRQAIAIHLRETRAVRCNWQQVIVVAGSQQALDLTARLLLNPGDTAWVEDPGYIGARAALIGAGARLIPVPVDEGGMDVAAGQTLDKDARLAFVTPSHQYPLGTTMNLTRRLALLAWANCTDAWVLEDDYDSDYRYSGRPFEALQSLDDEGRVIYTGTFSKVLFPALRLGYLVVPESFVDTFTAAREIASVHPPTMEQAVLAKFMTDGHLARHLRRMRVLYDERQSLLLEASKRRLAGLLDLYPAEAGIHLVGWLPNGVDDQVASRSAAAFGVEAIPLSFYSATLRERGGFVLGYSATNRGEIYEGVKRLAIALEQFS